MQHTNSIINIVVATDDNYAQHAAVTLMSAYEMCNKEYSINSYILDIGISEDKKQKIRDSLSRYNGEVFFIEVDKERFQGCYISNHYNSSVYYRLDLANILSDSIVKCLYVDCDVLFFDDVAKLWEINLQGHPIAAVEDLGLTLSKKSRKEKKINIGLKDDMLYFNSGVVLMDLEQWRENKYSEKCLSEVFSKNYISHDQDILNKVFLNNWMQLDFRWNVTPPITYLYPKVLTRSCYRKRVILARENPGILHYAGRYKAWEFIKVENFNKCYYDLLAKSEFKNVEMPQISNQNQGRNLDKELIRLKFADILSKFFS